MGFWDKYEEDRKKKEEEQKAEEEKAIAEQKKEDRARDSLSFWEQMEYDKLTGNRSSAAPKDEEVTALTEPDKLIGKLADRGVTIQLPEPEKEPVIDERPTLADAFGSGRSTTSFTDRLRNTAGARKTEKDALAALEEEAHRNETVRNQEWLDSLRSEEEIQKDLDAAKKETGAAKRKDFWEGLKGDLKYLFGGVNEDERGQEDFNRYQKENAEKIQTLKDELSERKWADYEQLRNNKDFEENSQYQSTKNWEKPKKDAMGRYTSTGYDDLEYEYVNGTAGVGDILESQKQEAGVGQGLSGQLLTPKEYEYEQWSEMTDDERALYNYIYKTQSPEDAHEYLEFLRSDLYARQAEKEKARAAAHAEAHPVESTLATVGLSPLKGLAYAGQARDYLSTGEIDENAPYNRIAYLPAAEREAVTKQIEQNWGELGTWAYGTGVSMLEFVLNSFVTGSRFLNPETDLGKMAEWASLMVMGTGAAADATISAKERGVDDDQAFWLGTVAGTAEVITEKVSIEALFSNPWEKSNLAKWLQDALYIGQNFGAEFSEETASDAINWTADVLIAQDKSEWRQAINRYMTEDHMSEQDAFLAALKDKGWDLLKSGLGGGFSGGFMAGSNVAYRNIAQGAQESYDRSQDIEAARSATQAVRNLGQEKPNVMAGIEQAQQQTAQPEGIVLPTGAEAAEAEMASGSGEGRTGNTLRFGTEPETKTLTPTVEEAETNAAVEKAEAEGNITRATGIRYGVKEKLIRTMERLGEITGHRVHFFAGALKNGKVVNGYTDKATGDIYINTKVKQPALFTFAHEFTHNLEGTDAYKALMDHIKTRAAETGTDWLAKRADMRQLYERGTGQQVDDAYVDEEILADWIGDNLSDEKTIREICRENPTAAKRIRDALDSFIIRAANAGGIMTDYEVRKYKNVVGMIERYIGEAGRDLEQTASENAQEVQENAQITPENAQIAPENAQIAPENAQASVIPAETSGAEVSADETPGQYLMRMQDLYADGQISEEDLAAAEDLAAEMESTGRGISSSTVEREEGPRGKIAEAVDRIAGRRYSISEDEDGVPFVRVDDKRIDTSDIKKLPGILRDIVKSKDFRHMMANGQQIGITTNRGVREWVRGKNSRELLRLNPKAYDDKQQSFQNADELLQTSRNYINEAPNHEGVYDSFARGTVRFKVGDNGYEADILVGIRPDQSAELYNIVNVVPTKITESRDTGSSAEAARNRQENSVNPIIADSADNVNRDEQRFSMSPEEAEEYDGREAVPSAKKDSAAVSDLNEVLPGSTNVTESFGDGSRLTAGSLPIPGVYSSPSSNGIVSQDEEEVKPYKTISVSRLLDHAKDHFADVLPKEVLDHYGMERPASPISGDIRYSISPEEAQDYDGREAVPSASDEFIRKYVDHYKEDTTTADELSQRETRKGLHESQLRSAFSDIVSQGGADVNGGEERFSLSPAEIEQRDEEYMRAVDAGDTETQQRMVDEAAERAGYTRRMWHGAKNGKTFTTFRGWSYFTEDRAFAEKYTNRDPENLYGVYAKVEHPFDTRTDRKARRIFEEARRENGFTQLGDSGLPDWTDGYDLADYIDENELDYDGILLDEGEQYVPNARGELESRGRVVSYVIRDSAQIKSADPVTYDDEGNVIPLSERFSPEQEDIRYSLAEEKRQDRDDRDQDIRMSMSEAGAYDYSKSFAEQIEDYTHGKIPPNDTLVVGGTPKVFQDIGLLSLPMTYDQDHVKDAIKNEDGRHLGKELLKNLPEAMEHPIAIIDSETVSGRLVAIIEIPTQDGKTIAAVEVEGGGKTNGRNIDSNWIHSVYTKPTTYSNLLWKAMSSEGNNQGGIYYWDKKKAVRQLLRTGVQFPRGHSRIPDGFIRSIHDPLSRVNTKIDSVTKTKQFGDFFGEWWKNRARASKVVDENGEPLIVYHQTGANIEEFDNSNPGAGAYDSETPNGYFFKANDHDIGLEGKKQMAFYLNMRKPLHFQNRVEANAWYCKNIDGYEDLQDKMNSVIDPIDQQMNEIENRMFAAETQEEEDALEAEWNELYEEMHEAEDLYRGQLRELLNDYFLSGNSGYDGIILDDDGHRYVNGKREDVKTYIVFNKNQMKSATDNIGLYDKKNNKVRYSLEEEGQEQNDLAGLSQKAKTAALRIERQLTMDVAQAIQRDLKPDPKDPEFRQFRAEVARPVIEALLRGEDADPDAVLESTGIDIVGQAAARGAVNDALRRASGEIGRIRTAVQQSNARQQARETRNAEIDARIPDTTAGLVDLANTVKAARNHWNSIRGRTIMTEEDLALAHQLATGQITEGEAFVQNAFGMDDIVNMAEAEREFLDANAPWERYTKRLMQGRFEEADGYLQNADQAKDKASGFQYDRETPERNFRDVFGSDAAAMIDKYIRPVHTAEAASTRFKNEYNKRVKDLKLSQKVTRGNVNSEAAAVQFLGEAEDNIRVLELARNYNAVRDGRTLEEWRNAVQEFVNANPNLDYAKVRRGIEEFQQIYKEIITRMNEVLVENGYMPVNVRRGYFPHFNGGSDGVLATFAHLLGINIDTNALPTAINGLTSMFKPGKPWFSHAMERTGFQTDYDALQGFDGYLGGVSDVIHQTPNIRNLRALNTRIRYMMGDEQIRRRIDEINADDSRSEQEKLAAIQDLTDNGRYKLSRFVAWLDEYTNLLANKKSKLDRGIEDLMGRGVYTWMKNIEGRVAANMISGNLGSALTNFIPLNQAGAVLGEPAMIRGAFDTMAGRARGDGFAERSDFLTNRRGVDPLVMTSAQKISEVLSKPMNLIDDFTSEAIVRAAYSRYRKQGLDEQSAMQAADELAAGLMADRSKGAQPTIFGSRNPLLKLFTQFQVEVNNEFSTIFKDIPKGTYLPPDKKKNLVAYAAWTLLRYFIGAYLFNDLYEKVVGRRAALDPLDLLNDAVGDFTGKKLNNVLDMLTEGVIEEQERANPSDAVMNLGRNALEELPFIGGVLGGGRIPISSALPDAETIVKGLANENWSGGKKLETVGRELGKSVGTYILPPFAGGAGKKLWQTTENAIRGGRFVKDAEGNDQLQYPYFTDTPLETAGTLLQSALFGPTATEGGKDWVEGGFGNQSAKKTALYRELTGEYGESQREVWDLISGVRGSDKFNVMNAVAQADLSDESKARALSTLIQGNNGAKFEAANQAAGISADVWYSFWSTLPEFDSDNNNSFTQAEVAAALERVEIPLSPEEGAAQGLFGGSTETRKLTNSEKAALWSAYNPKWKAANNPFDPAVGERVVNRYNSEEDE